MTVICLRAQGQARSRGRANAMDHSGPRQQLDGRAQIPRPAVRVDLRVHELASDQAGGVQEDPIQVMVVGGAGVLAEVVPERLRDGGLHARRPRDAAGRQVLGDHGRHAAEQQVGAQQTDQVLVNGRARAGGERPGSLQRGLLANSGQELRERHRMHEKGLNTADGHGHPFCLQRELQEGSGADYVQRGHVLVEVAQCHDGSRARLNLVDEQQGAPGFDRLPSQNADLVQDLPWFQGVEATPVARLPLKVDQGDVREPPFAKSRDREGLANLTGAADQQGPAPIVFRPGIQHTVHRSPQSDRRPPCDTAYRVEWLKSRAFLSTTWL